MNMTEQNLPTNAEVSQFLMLKELVTGLYEDMKDLTKNPRRRLLTSSR